MHGYLYIDYDKDYTFSYTLGSDDYPTADGELVSYTFYSPSDSQWGKNSKGETTENNSRLDDVPSFTLPESLAPGEYLVGIPMKSPIPLPATAATSSISRCGSWNVRPPIP